ncbi:glycosyltransferase [candidate division KSB3 bacterium]|uniref:Glycosyltransferase n=1 Tax=candidate division KSB3 bacterium TaxID=2044937 RepID=A0A9D5JVZ7_9BACT|nr:glycosyltransferase [candidate division KSB3 bacterium]MBD3324716.1 glycosyltransferase [candidate division KSB3 bacterium]
MPLDARQKIVYVLGTLEVGGTERQVVETAIRLNREVFEPKLYCLSGGGELQHIVEQAGLDVTIFPDVRPEAVHGVSAVRRYVRKLLALYRYVRRERPDIVHCYLYTPSMYGGIASRLAGKAVLLTNRRCLGHFKDSLPHYQFLENIVNRFTQKILVNSEALKQDVLRRERVDPAKICVVYNGVDLARYTPDPAHQPSQKRDWGIPAHVPVVGTLANLIPYKGYENFFRAAGEICRASPEVRFVCIGEDRGIQAQLLALSRTLRIQDQVLFTGQVQDVVPLLNMLDIQVSASHEEGFSNAILEGMAMGKPLVATAVGGTPEAVVHEVTGFLVPPRDPEAMAQAIRSLLQQPQMALQWGANGRKRVEECFSMEKMIDKLEKLYLTLGHRRERG